MLFFKTYARLVLYQMSQNTAKTLDSPVRKVLVINIVEYFYAKIG